MVAKRFLPVIAAFSGFAFPWFSFFCNADEKVPQGTIVAIGGGGTPERVVERIIELAGGRNARILVIPQASERPEAGLMGKEFFEKRKVKNVTILDLSDRETALGSIADAGGIWISGGSQGLLMKRLREVRGVVKAIQDRYRSGAVVAGTSAGAAVMSNVMIAGDDIPLDRGLGLWPEVIIDQHFVVRKRIQRSFTAVLANHTLVGVGLDERTGVIMKNGKFEVIGESSVTVIDPRTAQRGTGTKPDRGSYRDVKIHLLHEGESWQFESP